MQIFRDLCAGELPQLVMFDLDGTLIDSVPDIATAIDTALTALGQPAAGEAKVRAWVGEGAAKLMARALADASVSEEMLPQAMVLFKAAYKLCCCRSTRLYPGALELLKKLDKAGVNMAITTNKPVQFAHPILAGLGIAQFFQQVLGGECVDNKKPAPDMLLQAMKDLDSSPQCSLLVGDSGADIGAARSAGVKVIAVSYGYDNGAPVADLAPDALVDSLLQLC